MLDNESSSTVYSQSPLQKNHQPPPSLHCCPPLYISSPVTTICLPVTTSISPPVTTISSHNHLSSFNFEQAPKKNGFALCSFRITVN